MHSFYTPEFPRRRIASLAKVVDDAAEQGDTLASEILHVAGQSLASLQASVRRRLFADDESVPVSYLGGVFESRSVRERFRMLVALDINNDVQHPQFGPAHGALMEAYKLAGITARPTGGDPHL